jgi:hypothetical protein
MAGQNRDGMTVISEVRDQRSAEKPGTSSNDDLHALDGTSDQALTPATKRDIN